MSLEEKLQIWASPPSATEQEKMQNAENVIRNAIKMSPKLSHRLIKVMAQGSYNNNTNIPIESDVDIAIISTSPIFPKYPPGTDWTSPALLDKS